jgi:hypothetical protein
MNRLKSIAFLILITPLFLSADDTHEGVGVRTPTEEIAIAPEQEKEAHCGFIFDRYPPVFLPSNSYLVAAVSPLGDQVQLNDGSTWRISSYDGYKVLNWKSTDSITVTQNTRWFSNYVYRLVNQSTGSSAEATLFQGPFVTGPLTRYILSIDYSIGTILLTDNTHWEVSASDQSIFREWLVNDAVIVGTNSGWDSSSESLLINVTLNNFLRAHQY